MSDLDALRMTYLTTLLESAGRDLTDDERKASATIVRMREDGTKEYRYPMPDTNHARIALAMVEADDLSESEKDKVRTRAEKMLEAAGMKKSMPPWMKDKMKDGDEEEAEGDEKKAKKGQHKMPNGKMMKGEKHSSMKEGYGKKKEMMKEGYGKDEEWSGGGDTGKTGDPKKKPMKGKGKSWLAKKGQSGDMVAPD
jgi:hypothetical protein